ncbi:tannase and feruloyl esterase [Diaporthe helianthi]|uniref:Carboxylic ester hydrolase n=1 Tax=Diaporthe helianthi TaxID=158607 RepID=A0A2P5HMH8_DIAHE|nr:tannase and feruloyl esterase [Diaporthe helianthi]
MAIGEDYAYIFSSALTVRNGLSLCMYHGPFFFLFTVMALTCVPATFGDIIWFGAKALSLETNLVTNYSTSVPSSVRFTQPAVQVHNASFCNITITYTHPGQDDNIIVEAWLPAEGWNGRLQAVGGGGMVAGRWDTFYGAMAGAIADGYATVTTDAGLGNAIDATPWALLSPGNVNLYALQNLASVSLEDEGILAKHLINSYYGRGPDYSYFNGCSQGGRQGLMLAQRYPTAFDGIAAGAPAIFWNEIFTSSPWPQQFMNMLGEYPHPCELEAITAAAVSACDGLDGVVDGILTNINDCLAGFQPFDLVGGATNCSEAPIFTSAAAAVVNATWQGMRNAQGVQTWFGLNPGVPFAIAAEWFTLFVARDTDFDLTNLSHVEFDALAHHGRQRYDSIIGTGDADLSAFRDAGGKLVTFHGTNDVTIPPGTSVKYYNEVSDLTPNVDDFYRHFEVPGMSHCTGGQSGDPTSLFDQLRAWVENGTAPEESPVEITDLAGATQSRILCPYHKRPFLTRTVARRPRHDAGPGTTRGPVSRRKRW